MPWFKVDDGFHSHPKVIDLPLEAIGAWTLAGAWCAQYLTDGHITPKQLVKAGGDPEHAEHLVAAGLWEETEAGWQFANWTEYQPTKDKVEADREASAERQRKARERKKSQRNDPHGVTSESQRESQRDANVSHSVSHSARVTPPRPDPARPEVPKGTSTTAPEGRGRKKPATPIPDDWTPSDAHKTRSAELGVDAALEAEKFYNHAKANDRRQADWSRSFYTWLANARTFQDRSPAGGQQFRSSAEKRVDAGRAWLARSEGWDDARAAADNPFELDHPDDQRRITG